MGKTFGRIKGTFALLGLVSIGVIYAIVTGWNPLPGWADWFEKVGTRTLSTPAPAWSKRIGDQPDSATVLSSGIVVAGEGTVEVRDPVTGTVDWARPDSWAGVAGSTLPVVVVGRPVGTGFDVFSVSTGVRLWSSTDKVGIWPYANMILILKCSGSTDCALRSVDPQTGHTRWSTAIGAQGSALDGLNQALAAPVPVSSAYAGPIRAIPPDAPPLIGLPVDGQVHVIDIGTGRALHTFSTNAGTRVVVAGRQVISSSATLRAGRCYYTVTASSPVNGRTEWQRSGIDLRTATGLGCEASRNPYGSGSALLGIDTDGHDVVISATTGSRLLRAGPGERVVALDGRLAMIRTADHQHVRAVDLSNGHRLWEQPAKKAASIGIAPAYVIVADPTGDGRLVAYSRPGGVTLMSVTSNATVLGIGPSSVLINIGRTVGPVPVAAAGP